MSPDTKRENPALEKLMTSACFFPVDLIFNAQVRTSPLTGEVVSYCFEVSLTFQTSLESLEFISIKFYQEGGVSALFEIMVVRKRLKCVDHMP